MTTGADVQATFAATLVDEWVRGGFTDAVVAPGSRSTPVLAALAADGRLRLHVVLDERSGGFVALGIGLATGRPALVVTTSGTAAVELHPAVVEAHQAGVPLLAVTSDRPSELHHVGAPQTVEQAGLFAGVTRWAVNPGVADTCSASSWRSLAARTVAETTTNPAGPGPVHLNLELREPLLGEAGDGPEGRAGGRPWHLAPPGAAPTPSEHTVALLVGGLDRRGLIVAGSGAPPADDVLALAETLGWPVFADPCSGCRVDHPLVVAGADSLLRAPGPASWHPETVVRFGRPWASKVLAQWLAGPAQAATQVLVDPTGSWADPQRRVAVVERGEGAALCRAVVARLGGRKESVRPSVTGSVWAARWSQAEALAQAAIDGQLAAEPVVTEAAVARTVVASLPAGATLLASSSMPVRDVEWWGAPRKGLRVVANRGANGIDGIVSTAIGVAVGAGGPTAAVLGDLAFLYDAGALLGAAGRELSLTLVVVDNDGGGIFSFLPQAAAMAPDLFERLLSTPHRLDLVTVAAAYGVTARSVDDLEELRRTCASPQPGISVVVVRTDRAENVVAHDRLQAAVAAALTD